MPEIFLMLLSAGVMLAAAISDPRAVILRWLRLGGIIALAMAGLAGFFMWRRDARGVVSTTAFAITVVAILGQLATVQVAWRRTQRAFAAVGYAASVVAGTALLIGILEPRAKGASHATILVASALAGAVAGLSLMDMLLGHAYLNAARMTMAPFARLNRALALAMVARAALSVGGIFVIQAVRPVEMFWGIFGLYVVTRWLVGLVVPGVFVFMASDCIKRRATQSATGILYVAGVLIFIGEIIGLYVMQQTGMPL